ncbi:TetR/AcrR family transcriptional regulator [Nocardioides sp. SYSU D00038]|uniref:TetR/AcrR family transcriptional regulator n=1 Tax=Nocardioides sp. SYSU D00038 TaxID=2812554 RepID=UPI001967A3B8|nr:TetR/AcrR family transcriptional regulator [Nocardioides sp. SYSU D00038]
MAEEKTSGRRRWPEGYDPQRTRSELVASALRLFEENGFDRTSLQQIVVDANLTKGAFYHHFESKEDLLWRIQTEYLDTQLEGAQAIVEQGGDPIDQVRELIRLSLEGVAQHRPHVAIFQQERRHLTGERLAEITRRRDEVEALFRGAVQAGIDAGRLRGDVSARIVTFGILGMCAWAFQWFNPRGSLSIDDVATQFTAMVLDGLVAGA